MKQPNLDGSGSKAKFVALIKGAIIFGSGILAIQIPITNKHCPSKLFQSLVFGVVDVNDLVFRSVCAFILIFSVIACNVLCWPVDSLTIGRSIGSSFCYGLWGVDDCQDNIEEEEGKEDYAGLAAFSSSLLGRFVWVVVEIVHFEIW